MVAPQPPPAPRVGMSLYANLVDSDPDPNASISREPVLFRQDDAPKKAIDPALRFQPIRRPQAKLASKTKPPKAAVSSAPAPAPAPMLNATTSPAHAPAPEPDAPRNTLADWAATEEDEFLYGNMREQRQRGGRRRKKKKTDNEPLETDWDELYDPARPTNVDEYLRSDERLVEMREWKDVLYAHRRRRATSSPSPSPSVSPSPSLPERNDAFAPPASLNFAPRPMSPPRAPAEPTAVPGLDLNLNQSPPPAQDGHGHHGATISRAPVRYEPPPPDAPVDDRVDYDAPAVDGTEAPRTNRPGQTGFARRFMAKYGWTTGSGLGADGAGITSALRVHVEKRRRRPDAEGGGFAEPGGARGTIIAGKPGRKKKPADGDGGDDDDDGGGLGPMSPVVVLRNMLENMPDLAAEVEAGLGQEIGEECGEKYGRVERLHIDVVGRQVFIKFTDQVSALRAVNALDGRVFNGNAIAPKFYDAEKFENAIYS